MRGDKTPGARKHQNDEGQLLLKEGEYGKDARGIWQTRPPGCHMGSLASHKIVEHGNGTITVSPSILVTDENRSWHGYLERGVWREV